MPALRAIFAGGGTGGHLYPALAIAEELKKIEPTADILFVGTAGKIEARVVPQTGFRLCTIWISGFHRSLRISNILFPLKVIVALVQSFLLLRKFRPQVVVGTGGYVSGPVLYIATLMRIPTLIQEQNSHPGETTRFLARRVDEVHVTFDQSLRFLRTSGRVHVSGNPIRGNLSKADRRAASAYFGFDPGAGKDVILVVGGSLGAHTINVAIAYVLDGLIAHNFCIIWQTGSPDFEAMQKVAAAAPPGRVWIGAYIDRVDYAYAASTLVVCRAGATTIAELTSLGKASIMIPYPHAAANHQVENARSMVAAGAAMMVADHEARDRLLPALLKAIEPPVLTALEQNSRLLGRPEAARTVAAAVARMASAYAGDQEIQVPNN